MFFSFPTTEILYISSRVLLHVFRFNFSFSVNNGLEKKVTCKNSWIDIKTFATFKEVHIINVILFYSFLV